MHVESETRALLSDAAGRVIWSDWNYEGFWFPFIFWVVPECYSDFVLHKGMPHCVDVRPYQVRLGFVGLPFWSWNQFCRLHHEYISIVVIFLLDREKKCCKRV